MEETLFYALGLVLVVLALIVSAIGLKVESFPPSKPVLAIGTALFATLVVATGAYAWLNGEEEQEHREAEIAAGELLSPQEGLALANEPGEDEATAEGAEGAEETAPEGGETASIDGATVFMDQGCGGCHILADAGTSATTGPALDDVLAGKDADFVETSIVDPNAEIADDFPPDVMPQSYGTDLGPEELDALVQYLLEATGSRR